MDERDRQAAKQRATQRIQKCHEPAVAVMVVDPDQHRASRFDGACHPLQSAPWMFEAVNDADCEGDIEAIGNGEIIGARAHDLTAGKGARLRRAFASDRSSRPTAQPPLAP